MSDEKTLQSFDSIKTVISEVDDSDHAVSIKEIELNVQDLQSKELSVNVYQNTDLRKNSNSNTVLSVSSDQGRLFDIFFQGSLNPNGVGGTMCPHFFQKAISP